MIPFIVGFAIGIFGTFIILWSLLRDQFIVAVKLWNAKRKHLPVFFVIREDNNIVLRNPVRIEEKYAIIKEGNREYPVLIRRGEKRIPPLRLRGTDVYICSAKSTEVMTLEQIQASGLASLYFDEIKKALEGKTIAMRTEDGEEKIFKIKIESEEDFKELLKAVPQIRSLKCKLKGILPPLSLDLFVSTFSPVDMMRLLNMESVRVASMLLGLKKEEKKLAGLGMRSLILLMIIAGLVILIIMFLAPALSRLAPTLGRTLPRGQGVGG